MHYFSACFFTCLIVANEFSREAQSLTKLSHTANNGKGIHRGSMFVYVRVCLWRERWREIEIDRE